MAPKKQTQKMSLGDFLGNQSKLTPTTFEAKPRYRSVPDANVKPPSSPSQMSRMEPIKVEWGVSASALGSWADEMEDMPVTTPGGDRSGYGGGGDRRAFSSTASFGADRAMERAMDRGFARADPRPQLPLPTKPPYTAHLGNLPFDASNLDIEDFFAGCEVSNVRIVEDKLERKPKGFGYVEFRSLDGLKKALELSGTQFNGRDIRISVADPPKDRPEQREFNDWTRKGPLPDLPQQQRRASERGGFGSGGPGGYEPPPMERGGSRRSNFDQGDGKVRDFSNWERKGPLSPVPGAAAPQGREGGRPRNNEPRERKLSPSWGEGRSQGDDGSRPPKREFVPRPPQPERAPTAAEKDNQWRAKMRPDAPVTSGSPTPDPSVPSSPAAQPAAPATRPKLNLAKRTVSEAQPSDTGSASDAKASPFGAARPVDTAAKEREVAEKREIAIRQKKEADDKAREEKKAREAPSKEDAESAADADEANGEKENGSGPKYEILSRDGDDGEENEAQDAPANGEIVDDKAVKPREFTRDPPKGPRADRRGDAPARGGASTRGGDSWRGRGDRKSSTPNARTPKSPEPESTGEKLEDDGWSTVAAKPRGGRGRGGARAIAS